MEPAVKSKRAPSAWAKAVSEHIKGGGSFPRKGSADYEAVTKIKERMAKDGVKDKEPVVTVSAPKTPRAKKTPVSAPAPAEMVPDAREIVTKPALDAPKPKTPRKPRVMKDSGDSTKVDSKAMTLANVVETKKGASSAVPLARLATTPGVSLPFTNTKIIMA